MSTKRYIDTIGLAACLLGCLLLAGCDSSRTLGSVSGCVSLDGKPCGGLIVVFACEEQRAFITANVGEDGSYTVQMAEGHGLPLGTYDVSIRPAPPTNWDRPPITTQIPPRYRDAKSSGLKLTVVEGENQFDIPMTTR
ncbi:MAG: hypothetical protein U9N87_03980 [Planctomycetota bacterium]|nr:hypothetical protein [Planctomycetota bacterium]